jgi:hypothetical protein
LARERDLVRREHEMKKKTDGAPDSIRYFEKPIARLYARLQQQERELAELQAKQGRQG